MVFRRKHMNLCGLIAHRKAVASVVTVIVIVLVAGGLAYAQYQPQLFHMPLRHSAPVPSAAPAVKSITMGVAESADAPVPSAQPTPTATVPPAASPSPKASAAASPAKQEQPEPTPWNTSNGEYPHAVTAMTLSLGSATVSAGAAPTVSVTASSADGQKMAPPFVTSPGIIQAIYPNGTSQQSFQTSWTFKLQAMSDTAAAGSHTVSFQSNGPYPTNKLYTATMAVTVTPKHSFTASAAAPSYQGVQGIYVPGEVNLPQPTWDVAVSFARLNGETGSISAAMAAGTSCVVMSPRGYTSGDDVTYEIQCPAGNDGYVPSYSATIEFTDGEGNSYGLPLSLQAAQ